MLRFDLRKALEQGCLLISFHVMSIDFIFAKQKVTERAMVGEPDLMMIGFGARSPLNSTLYLPLSVLVIWELDSDIDKNSSVPLNIKNFMGIIQVTRSWLCYDIPSVLKLFPEIQSDYLDCGHRECDLFKICA